MGTKLQQIWAQLWGVSPPRDHHDLRLRLRFLRGASGTTAVLILLYLLLGLTSFFAPFSFPWGMPVLGLLAALCGWLVWRLWQTLAQATQLVQEKTAALAALTQRLARLEETGRETAVLQEQIQAAHDLNNTLAQSLTDMLTQLEAVEDDLVNGERQGLQLQLDQATALARQSLQKARRSRRPQSLEELGLPDALRQMVQRLTPGTLVRGQVRVTGDVAPLGDRAEAELLHIAQASVTNALKHAKPSAINVTLAYLPEMVRLVVQDNGRGFDPAQPAAGFGLTGMRERAMQIGAQLTVNMRPEGGSEVVCLVKR